MELLKTIQRARRKIFYFTHKREDLLNAPSSEEEEKINKIRGAIKNLPPLSPKTSVSDAEKIWLQFSLNLREKIINSDPRNFLNWEVIQYTMFHDASYLEYRELKKDWSYWKKNLMEDKFGNPMPYYLDKNTSGNLVHYAYSLEQLRKISIDIKNFDQIVEVGGGYGGMARLIFNLGFTGNYIIYDLPEFSALQEYYLSSISEEIAKKISFVSRSTDLKNKFATGKKTLFIATWSLSEMALTARQEIFEAIGKIDTYLIAYRKTFGEVNNEEYFSSFLPEEKIKLKKNYRIDHLQDDYYLLTLSK
jgi:hypothetical protein